MTHNTDNKTQEENVETEDQEMEIQEPTAEEPTVKEVIKEIEVEVEVNVDYKDKWLRAQADYSNLVKETAEKRSEWASMSEWHILEEFIPVYDNFKKAFAVEIVADIENDEIGKWQNWKQGIGYIMKQFGDILKQHGIEEIETVGAAFDPTMHEALSEESSDEHEDGAIIREVNAGYKKGERVLKVAGVVLNKR